MKIEIDLDALMRDEDGNPEETMQESIRRQVVENITKTTTKEIKLQISQRVQQVVDDALAEQLKTVLPALIDEVLNGTYIPVDGYGRRKEPTTFRTQVIDLLQNQMVYEKRPNSFNGENAFTRAVDAAVAENLKAFQKAFAAQCDDQFIRSALTHAVETLRARLGLPKA